MIKAREARPFVLPQFGCCSPQIDRRFVAICDVTSGVGHIDGSGQRPQQLARRLLAFSQLCLSMLLLGDVPGAPEQLCGSAVGLAKDFTFDRNPPCSTIALIGSWSQTVF